MVWQQLSYLRLLTQSKGYKRLTFPAVPARNHREETS